MENRPKRTSAPRTYRKCPCCSNEQPKSIAKPAKAQKRKRVSLPVSSPPSPPLPVACSPRPSAADVDHEVSKPSSIISPEDLPAASCVAPQPRPSTAPLQDESPITIHNYSVEEYKRIYHEVVDDMQRYKNGNIRRYSLKLGRQIKQKLWERLNRPTITTSENEDGLINVTTSYGTGIYPPCYDVVVKGEPKVSKPPRKRAKQTDDL